MTMTCLKNILKGIPLSASWKEVLCKRLQPICTSLKMLDSTLAALTESAICFFPQSPFRPKETRGECLCLRRYKCTLPDRHALNLCLSLQSVLEQSPSVPCLQALVDALYPIYLRPIVSGSVDGGNSGKLHFAFQPVLLAAKSAFDSGAGWRGVLDGISAHQPQ